MLRIKSKNQPVRSTIADESDDPTVVASENVKLQKDFERYKIGRPRASSLHSCCIRMHVIGAKLEKEKISSANVSMRLTYGMGNALHWWIQNTPDVFGNKRRGWWRCMACNTVLYFGAPPKKNCTKCGARPEAITYHEHWMRLRRPFHVSGHPDMFLLKNKFYRVVEAKSMNEKDFGKLVAPLVDHEWQVMTYMWGLSHDKKFPVPIDHTVGYVAYIIKKHVVKSFPIKMYPVQYSIPVVKRITAKLQSYETGMKTYPKQLPPLDPVCERNEMDCYKVRGCAVGPECKKFWRDGI